MRNPLGWLLCSLFVSTAMAQDTPASSAEVPLEQFDFLDESKTSRSVLGKMLIKAADGGLLVEDRAGTLWNITPDQFEKRTATGQNFAPLSVDERTAALKGELGDAFHVRKSEHYLVLSNTSEAYTEWCSALLERFYVGFFAYWADFDLDLHEPSELLTVIIFRNEAQFREFYSKDVGQKTQSSFGYFSIRRNRTVLYDFADTSDGKQTLSAIRRATARVPFNVATIVHEATHQLGFNCGLHRRYADNPVWLTEGIAMFFETPDLRSSGWKTIGRANPWRIRSFKPYGSRMSAGSVRSLVRSTDRFLAQETAGDAYTESWALTHYLMNRRKDEFIAFVKAVSEKPLMVWDKPPQREEMFVRLVGDPEDFERVMQAYLRKYRR